MNYIKGYWKSGKSGMGSAPAPRSFFETLTFGRIWNWTSVTLPKRNDPWDVLQERRGPSRIWNVPEHPAHPFCKMHLKPRPFGKGGEVCQGKDRVPGNFYLGIMLPRGILRTTPGKCVFGGGRTQFLKIEVFRSRLQKNEGCVVKIYLKNPWWPSISLHLDSFVSQGFAKDSVVHSWPPD